jgi:hypothetical protein
MEPDSEKLDWGSVPRSHCPSGPVKPGHAHLDHPKLPVSYHSEKKKSIIKLILGRGWGQGEEMNQALYAHMNNKRKMKK